MDVLSDVLAMLKPASYMFRALDACGDWAVQFQAKPCIMCYAVLSGQVWLSVEGIGDSLLRQGDCVLLTKGLAVRVGSAVGIDAVDAWDVFPQVPEGGAVTINGGGDAYGLGGFFEFGTRHADMLIDVLPAIVHIREESDRVALRSSIERIMQELREPQPGSFMFAQHLAHLMLLQALRIFMAEERSGGVGWLYALSDRQITTALNAMHHDPAHKWTLQALADRAAMSRSTFALRFKQLVGESPMDYLTRWRMLLASNRLLTARDAIAVIAPSLGYDSESAFSTAFKRVIGCSPSDYTRSRGAFDKRS